MGKIGPQALVAEPSERSLISSLLDSLAITKNTHLNLLLFARITLKSHFQLLGN